MRDWKYIIENRMPATVWQDATPLGNGKVGALVYGSIYDERILLNHENLYDGAVDLPIPDISAELPVVRRLLDEKKYQEADSYYVSKLKEHGYYTQTGDYLPAFDIHMISATRNAFTGYFRRLDMRRGLATVRWMDGDTEYKREVFADQVSGAVIMRLSASSPILDFQVRLEEHDLSDAVDSQGDSLRDGLPRYTFLTLENSLEGRLITRSGKEFSAKMRVFSDGQTDLIRYKDVGKLNDMQGTLAFRDNYYSVKNASEAVIVCFLADSDEKNAYVLPSKPDYDIWLLEHTERFSAAFDSMRLDLGAEEDRRSVEEQRIECYNGNVTKSQIEKTALFGRYLLISSSMNCRLPANLQGIWNGAYRPAWSCTFFNNENIEMNYWQALGGNLSETMLPLFDFYLTMMDDYRENARKLFGCRGILLPMFCDNSCGKKKNLQAHVVYWTASSSWIANMFFDYYLFTRDRKFLAEKAFPFMKEAALFYEDYMQRDENGKLKSYPSNSPENCAKGNFEGSENVRVCINATMDFATLKQLLRDLIESEDILGICDEKDVVWKRMLADIPPYAVNADGALCEWMHDDFKDNYGHRHVSHLYPLFPGREITKRDKELFEACKNAVLFRYRLGLKEQTGWSFAHLANLLAKLGEGDYALDCLKLLIRFCTGNNMFAYHNDCHNQGITLKFLWARHAPFQIDANFGFTAAVQQMLIDSDEHNIDVFPAVPQDWDNLYIGPCPTRCGVNVCAERKGKYVKLKLHAIENTEFTVNCGPAVRLSSNAEISLKKGEEIFLEGMIE
ncbi:MAG: glycosyl hydrolase family 95 catalytic domain-containing protein [Christensenellales bacterium]